jgi:hypothetical protein
MSKKSIIEILMKKIETIAKILEFFFHRYHSNALLRFSLNAFNCFETN